MLGDRLALAVKEGDITADDAKRFTASLQARDREKTFFGSAIGYTVAGTKPE